MRVGENLAEYCHWGRCTHFPRGSDDHVYAGPISLFGGIKETPRAICTLAATTVSACTARSARHIVLNKG